MRITLAILVQLSFSIWVQVQVPSCLFDRFDPLVVIYCLFAVCFYSYLFCLFYNLCCCFILLLVCFPWVMYYSLLFLFLSSSLYVRLSAYYFFYLTILFLLLFVFLVDFNYFPNSFTLVVFYILLYIGKRSGLLFPDRAWTAKITQSCFLVNLHNLVFLC